MATVALTDQSFADEVIHSDIPVLVDFWADWCQPCKVLAPILEEISEMYAGQLKVAKIDTDAQPMVAGQLRIQSLPTLIIFDQGRPVKAAQGALPKAQLIEFLEANLPSLSAGPAGSIKVEQLAQLLEAGQPVTLIDVREENNYSRSHLRHAQCVAPEKLAETYQKLAPGSMVVLICRTGEISKEWAEKIQAPGLQIVSLEKGILEWEGEGQPTFSNKEEAALDRQEA